MKAIQVREFGGPEALELCDAPMPEPRADEVLVRVKAAGVNPYRRVFATAGSERGRSLVRDQGSSLTFDHHTFDYRDAILAATHGRGVDVIIEVLANANLARDATSSRIGDAS